jgi:hypothetical protein
MDRRTHVRLARLLGATTIAASVLLFAWPASAEDAPGFVRLASRPAGVAVPPVPAATSVRTLLLWRHQYEWSGSIRPSKDPAHVGASGRILELTEVGDDGTVPGPVLWTLSLPFTDAAPRPLRAEDVTWDPKGKSPWVFTCSCDVGEAEVKAWRVVPTPTAASPGPRLSEWPRPGDATSRHVAALPGWRGARVDRVRAFPQGEAFVVALTSTTAKATIWLSFDPEAGTWSSLEAKPAGTAPPGGR